MKRFVFIPLLFLAASAFAQNAPTLDDSAKFLGGLPVKGPLEPLMQNEAWKNHAVALDDAWRKKEYHQLEPIRGFMNENASEAYNSTNTAYYMFGGPDFLYAHTFFPNANTYILAGLEPVGQVPDLSRLSPEMLGGGLSALRASMHTILQTHYFITKDMRTDLGHGNFGGTLPILYVFLARTGCTVLDTSYVKSPAEGVKITFVHHGPKQTLYYFKTDLSGGKSPFLSWCAKQGPGLSLLKAASYLMHGEGFGGVRSFLLENSRVIIQDDTGLPLRSFTKGWTVNFYGRYVPHKEMFGKYHQPDLAAIYAKNPPPPELGFAFGYHWQPERGILMMATRK
ncbi:MAG: hypothetical protein DMF06_04460 [Verrucomicrobia bacterium]|nr:MAG: hypothetical protein DMF06_04460 [Verrucomicrobiota bacterium]